MVWLEVQIGFGHVINERESQKPEIWSIYLNLNRASISKNKSTSSGGYKVIHGSLQEKTNKNPIRGFLEKF